MADVIKSCNVFQRSSNTNIIYLYSASTINIRWRCVQPKLVKVKELKLYLKLYYLKTNIDN